MAVFDRYFTLFMNLMSRCTDMDTVDRRPSERGTVSLSQAVNQSAVLAMSNLLNANIDTGLMYAIGEFSDNYNIRLVNVLLATLC